MFSINIGALNHTIYSNFMDIKLSLLISTLDMLIYMLL